MKNLPIGISTLRTIINNNMVYIDKTAAAYSLVKTPGRYFLSRQGNKKHRGPAGTGTGHLPEERGPLRS